MNAATAAAVDVGGMLFIAFTFETGISNRRQAMARSTIDPASQWRRERPRAPSVAAVAVVLQLIAEVIVFTG